METAVALPAGSPDRELGALALDFRSVLPLDTTADIPATIAGLQAGLKPLKEVEPGAMVRDPDQSIGFRFEGAATSKLADALRPIGMKLNPTMSPEQVGGWLAAMIASLSDLPARVVIRGANDALHVPIRFFPEVEGVIREKAQPHAQRYRVAIMRLGRLMREIAEAAKPKLPPPDLGPPPGPDDWARMARSDLGRSLLRIGLGNGYLSQEQFDAAMASHEPTEEVDDGKDGRECRSGNALPEGADGSAT
jgi:hypothetical protein